MLRTAFCILVLCASAGATAAQTVSGTLTGAGGEPVAGALVTLLDGGGAAARATVSRARGEFALATGGAGRYSLRVERPGLQPFDSEPFELAQGAALTLSLVVPAIPRGGWAQRAAEGPCVAGSVAGAAAGLWQDAALALSIMALAEEGGLLEVRGLRYIRVLDAGGELQDGVLEQEPFAGTVTPQPAPPVTELPRTGFVGIDPEGALQYRLPSPPILLSQSFLQTHCINRVITERGRRDQVGLGFRPAEGGNRVGIEGVLWLDRATARPREIDFEYRDPQRLLPRGARGQVGFQTGNRGLPQMSRWWLRAPGVFETRYSGGATERSGSTVESGVFVFGADDRPLEDPDGVFALIGGMFTLGPIVVEAERSQRLMSEGALKQIRLEEIRGAPPTDAWDIVSTLRPGWLARAESPALTDGASGGELVVYLDRMRLSTLNGDPGSSSYIGAPAALAQIPASWIASIEYIPPIEAAAIYGQGHGYGVVVIRSRRQ